MSYFASNYGRVQFVVSSDDKDWTRANVVAPGGQPPDIVNVTYLPQHQPGQDMAIMAMCDHMVMSTGTFGWWAGWLTRGTTIYYKDWPRNGSQLHGMFTREDFYPPAWIAM